MDGQDQHHTPASPKAAPKKALGFTLGSFDLQKTMSDEHPCATPLVKSTPSTDRRHTVLETPKQRNPSDEQKLPRIDREPTDEKILEYLRITLPQVRATKREQAQTNKPNKLFGAKNAATDVHEITNDGLLVRGRTLASPRAAAVTSD